MKFLNSAHFLAILLATAAMAAGQTTTIATDDFPYADGDVSTVSAGLDPQPAGVTGWNATEDGWQIGNSTPATRFIGSSGVALYQGGGGTSAYTYQNRSFATSLTSALGLNIDVAFTLIRPETQAGRGIGITLTNGGTNQIFIGKRVNGTVGLHSAMDTAATTHRSFATSGANEPIQVKVAFNGVSTTFVLSDSNETLAPYTVAGTFTFDGIALAGYNSATTTNGIDNISVSTTVADPLIFVSPTALNFGQFANNPEPVDLPVTIFNDGAALNLTIADTTAITGSSAFTIVSPTLPVDIAPGDSIDLTVRFDPGTSVGSLNGTLTLQSNDFNGTVPTIRLHGFVDPAGTVVARYDFDPSQVSGTLVDVDASGEADWTTGDLTDVATGIGAVSSGNQSASNRALRTGLTGNYLGFSCNRESDAQTPLASGGSNESTWTTFTITPDTGGGSIDFTGGTAVIDTYANTDQGSNTAANWTLYYSTDGGSNWTSLGTQTGQSTSINGSFGPLSLSWDLTPLGSRTTAVDFILDPLATGGTNGTVTQRGIGFDNLIITAGSVTPGTGGTFASWASGFSIPNNQDYDGTDNDGIPALVEYALGLSPVLAEGSTGTLTGSLLSFTKGAEAVTNGDVTYSIETSQNLTTWDPATPDTNNATTISYTLPTGQGKWFARLVVTQAVP